ncbi:MAG TPA: SRPBCC domain-containing protein [Acidimicrobiales bacterium]|jgi:uncharacterized protein YndB with AHSA1/START domain/DNA-binding transcriptional ArsR family regulator|nr:SRPBCC domain-containing protein [Acidimicrobiales bacterium]
MPNSSPDNLEVTAEDLVFRALSDPSRRRLLDRLNVENGRTQIELCAGLHMTRQSVTKHLSVLEEANLITTIRRGREKLHYLNPVPIHEFAERWIDRFEEPRLSALSNLKKRLETKTMDRPEFVYTTYIKTTPELLWQALTDPVFTKQWWNTTFETNWEVGTTMAWRLNDISIVNAEQVVLEYDPFRRLAYTWHTFTPELTTSFQMDSDFAKKIASEHRSRASFEITPMGDVVKLTIVHDDFDPGSDVVKMVTNGWPPLISSLKSLLETGEILSIS